MARTISMKRGLATLATIAGAAMVLTACSGGTTETPDADPAPATEGSWVDDLDPITLKVADWTAGDATTGIYGQAWVDFGERVTAATDGKVTFEYYWGPSLLNATDSLQGVGDGVADIGVVNSVYYPQELPIGSWLSGLGAGLTGSIVHDSASGSAVAFETVRTLEPLVDEFASNNLFPLVTVSSAPYNLICTEPIASLDDAAGKKVRTAGEPWTKVIEALGMTPVSLSYNEIYEGLQRGVIDCVTINPNQLVSSLVLQDVASYYHPLSFPMFQGTNFVMTLDVWEEFPAEMQELLHREAGQVAFDIIDEFIYLEGLAGEAINSGDVVTTVDVSELEPLVIERREAYLQELPASAPATLPNAQEVVDTYLAQLDYWNDFLVENGYELPDRTPEGIRQAFADLPNTDYSGFFEKFNEEFVEANLP